MEDRSRCTRSRESHWCYGGITAATRAAARCGMQVTQPSGPLPRALSTTAKVVSEDDASELPSRLAGSNEIRLRLSLIAHNPGNLRQRLASPRRTPNWSLTSLQEWPVKTGRPLVKPARHHWLLLAEGHLNRRLFGSLLGLIVALPQRGGWENVRESNLAAQKSSRGDKCHQGSRLEVGNRPDKAAERPKRAVMPLKRGPRDSSLS